MACPAFLQTLSDSLIRWQLRWPIHPGTSQSTQMGSKPVCNMAQRGIILAAAVPCQ